MVAFLDRHFITIGVLALVVVVAFINLYPVVSWVLIYPVAFGVAWKSLKKELVAEPLEKGQSAQWIQLVFLTTFGAAISSAVVVAIVMGITGVLLSGGGSGPETCIPRGPCY